ncbi:suppressor of fused domain protein [Paenibacillus agilis]|uniref:Suppressor of fused domain protein n=1 Tax=Paenibacillus agilis TaxID=3020863 RepID=A0A559J0A1_9BACL|nr:suppressor of fused domain protein [Paenibacillus agilis]TVX93302.1 suppressor of fused domain protein [Paenibacillus agilis]
MQINRVSSQEKILDFDIRRTIILNLYMKEWSMPEYRVIMTKPEIGIYIEIYYFPSINDTTPARFATVGLSNSIRKTGKPTETEWMLALKPDLGQESIDRIFSYFCDLIAHNIENITSSEVPRVMTESTLAPENWTTKALLIDELRGESEDLEEIKIGEEIISVLWIVPITHTEARIILQEGIDAFDTYIETLTQSIIDPTRPH